MGKHIPFRDRLRANILAAQLGEELKNDEYRDPKPPADTQQTESAVQQDGGGARIDTLNGGLDDSSPHSSTNRLTNSPPDSHSSGQAVSQTNQHTNYLSVKQINQHSSYPSYSQSNKRSYVPTTTDPVMCMTDTQARILCFLMDNNIQVIKYEELVNALGIPYGTVRWAIAKLEKENFLSKRKFRKGRIQGISVALNETLCRHFYEKRIQKEGKGRQSGKQTHWQSDSHTSYSTVSQVDTLTDIHSASKIDRKEINLSIKDKILGLQEDDVAFFYPNLHRIGFGPRQLSQVIEKLEKVGKDSDKIITSMEYAEWELSQGELRDKDGKVVQNPCAFIFIALARTGYYRRPPGYVSADELAARDLQEEAKRVREAKEIKEKAEFDIWVESLSKEEMNEIMNNRIGPREQWLLNYYKNKVANRD